MKWSILAIARLFPAFAGAQDSVPCENQGRYAFRLGNCPQSELNVDITVPLCQQPEFRHLSYLDPRCYQEVPFDYSKQCFEWDCPVPYDHVYVEPISGRTKVIRGSAIEIDQHFRAAHAQLVQGNNISQAGSGKKKGKKIGT